VSPIRPGDLVCVVRWPCCAKWLGFHFQVQRVEQAQCFKRFTCDTCHARHPIEPVATTGAPKGQLCNVPLSWLKRIPPLSELEDVKRTEELPA
jgi:hypothetical protein